MVSDISEQTTLITTPEEGSSTDLSGLDGLEAGGQDGEDGDWSTNDVPVQLDRFRRNVWWGKALLGPGLLASVGLEVFHLWAVVFQPMRYGSDQTTLRMMGWAKGCDIAGICLASACLVLYLLTILRPITIPLDPSPGIKNLQLHAGLCVTVFILFLILLVLQFAPSIAYIAITHRSAPYLLPAFPHSDWYRGAALLFTFLVGGAMRRGPRLRYSPLHLATGFGINTEDKRAPSGGPMVAGRGVTLADEADSDDELLDKPAATPLASEEPNVTDYAGSPLFSLMVVAYMIPLAKRSIQVPQLSLSDLTIIEQWVRDDAKDRTLSPSATGDGAIRLDQTAQKVSRWMLVKTLWKGRTTAILICFSCETLVTFFSYLPIIALHEIIGSRDDATQTDKAYARLMCSVLLVGQLGECLLTSYCWARENYNLHMPVKMALSSILFNKVLRTTDVKSADAHNMSKEDTAAGKGRAQIINLFTIDAFTIARLAVHAWQITRALTGLILGTYVLYSMFGVSAFFGIACIPLSTPLSIWVARMSYLADRGWARSRDARTSAIQEFLLCYKVIKLNAFEPYFKVRIENLRAIEVTWQRWRYTLGTCINILGDQLPTVAIFVVFLFYTKVFGNSLEPATAFVAFSIFNKIKDGMQRVSTTIQDVFKAFVAVNRLTEFLNRPEIDMAECPDIGNGIHLNNVTVTWPQVTAEPADDGSFRLRGMTVSPPEGKITLVCGPLGAGKTLFLRALLGEAHIEEGILLASRSAPNETPINGYGIRRHWTNSTWLDDSVSYAPQQAYIRHGSIRDNILFGQPMWRSRYKEVMRQASLLSDLALMGDGDLTEVGDHGINLSGGQKARINLARCLYSKARTIYLDDILSAVDAHTAQFIVNDCFQGELVRGRTVVLVTHQVNLCLSAVDYVISLKDGKIEQACPVHEAKVKDLEVVASPEQLTAQLPEPDIHSHKKAIRNGPRDDGQIAIPRQHYRDEHKSVGRVATSHYMLILVAAGGAFYWTVFALIYSGSCSFVYFQPLGLRYWTSHPDPSDLNRNLLIYLAATSIPISLGAFKWVWLYGWGYRGFYNRGSKVIHATLLDRIMSAPLSFFETTPAGRIMNVFGQDIWKLDSQSADNFGRTITAASAITVSSLVVCFQAPALLVILVGFGVPLYYLSGALRKLRADLRRINSTATSPLVTLYHDAIEGIVMIRAFGTARLMQASLHTLINRERTAESSDNQVYHLVRGTIRTIASVFVTATGFLLVETSLSGAQVGFILSFAVVASDGLFGLLEMYSNLEQTFVSAERVNHYIQMEDHESTHGLVPADDWPSRGSIAFNNFSVRYAEDLPEILHDVSFKINPGIRVGLVGATGSGKSTLALSLFRAIDPHRGNIEIDGIDIRDVQLSELRKRLNMVVQDGTLCSGTLRDALDISGVKDDHEIYEALRRVHLLSSDLSQEDMASNPFANLDTFVAVEGANFSHGQRQLLCLARALLKDSKILVMDEATSSVDFEMDAKITHTIKECFTDTTMIVIAHRLATIMQYDRVLVLDKGVVKEYDAPLSLVQDPKSAFHSLCMAQGQDEYDKLVALTGA